MILIWQRVVSRSSAILAPACRVRVRVKVRVRVRVRVRANPSPNPNQREVAWCAEVAWRGCSYGAWRGEGQGRMLVLRELAR